MFFSQNMILWSAFGLPLRSPCSAPREGFFSRKNSVPFVSCGHPRRRNIYPPSRPPNPTTVVLGFLTKGKRKLCVYNNNNNNNRSIYFYMRIFFWKMIIFWACVETWEISYYRVIIIIFWRILVFFILEDFLFWRLYFLQWWNIYLSFHNYFFFFAFLRYFCFNCKWQGHTECDCLTHPLVFY
jgi:hypothetical protein